MKIVYLLILFITGLSIINLVSTKFSILEKTGLSFPLGFGFVTIMMFLLELLGISFDKETLLFLELVLIFICLGTIWWKNDRKIPFNFPESRPIKSFSFFSLNLSWMLVVGCLAYLLYVTFSKALFWPTIAYDSITGYDFMGRMMAMEGTVKSSMFSDMNPFYSIRCGYPLFVPGSYGYTYMLGFDTSKITVVILMMSLVIAFYGFLKQFTNNLAAAIFTLLFISTPEFIAMGALSLSNVPHSLFVVSGIISMFLWMERGQMRYFYLAVMLLALNVWTRSDGVNFLVGAGFMVLLNSIRTKEWKPLIMLVLFTSIPFLAWQIYLTSTLNIENSNVFMKTFSMDGDKFSELWTYISTVLKSTQYFGVAPYLISIGIAANSLYLLKVHYQLLIMILVSFIIYIVIYYQMDFSSENFGYSIKSMVLSSYKRGMFSFVGLFYFYIAISPISKRLFHYMIEHKALKNFTNGSKSA